MRLTTTTLAAAVVSGGLLAAVLGLGTATAIADAPHRRPRWGSAAALGAGKACRALGGPARGVDLDVGWPLGVWINDGFITLSANPVTNGG